MTTTSKTFARTADGRSAWLEDVCSEINVWHFEHGHAASAPIELIDAALARITAEGPAMGRTDRWQNGVAFFAAEVEQDGSEEHRRWTLLQGIVWLGYANL